MLNLLLFVSIPIFVFLNPFLGLYIYLVFEGYIGMQAIQFFPLPEIQTQLANANQLIVLVLVLRGTIIRGKKLYLPKYAKPLAGFVLIFGLWGFLTYFWADFTQMEMLVFQLKRLLKMLVFVLAAFLTIQSHEQLKKVLILGLGIYFIQDLVQITEFAMSGRAVIHGGGLSLLAVAIIMLQKNIKPYQKVFFLFCIFLVVSSFLLAGTRRGFGALAIVLLITIYMHASRRTFFNSFFIILIIGLAVNWLADVELTRRIAQTKRLVSFEDRHAWSGRNYLWRSGWAMVKERPVTGHGYGINQYIMSDYSYKIGVGYMGIKRMHNTYLKAWAEMGIIGLLSFIGILYFMIRSFYLSANGFKQQGNWILYVLLFASFANMLGYVGLAMFGWSGYLDKPFWFQTGLALAASKILLKSQLSQKMIHT